MEPLINDTGAPTMVPHESSRANETIRHRHRADYQTPRMVRERKVAMEREYSVVVHSVRLTEPTKTRAHETIDATIVRSRFLIE